MDAETPRVRLLVGVVLALFVGENVGLLVHVCDIVAVVDRVLVPVAVLDALAPRVRLLVGVYDACGQKHIGRSP